MWNVRDIRIRPCEWLIIAAAFLMGGAIYSVLIHPSLQLIGYSDSALHQRQRAESELAGTTEAYEHLRHRIDKGQERLKELGGAPPSSRETDRQIGRLMSLAQRLLVTIDRYQPIETVDQADHRAFFVEFTGRGNFLAFQQYFRQIEKEIDFVDVTNFSITHVENQEPPLCLATWSCRINGMRTEEPVEPGTPSEQAKPRLREVAWHEP